MRIYWSRFYDDYVFQDGWCKLGHGLRVPYIDELFWVDYQGNPNDLVYICTF